VRKTIKSDKKEITMSTITLEPKLQHQLDHMVQFWDKSIDEILEEAINERMEELNTQKLDAETEAFKQMHPLLRRDYKDQFVAIHQRKVVDSDADLEALVLRIQARFGDLAVLIRQVRDSLKEEWRLRGVRWEVF